MQRVMCKKCSDILPLDESSKDLIICKCGNLQIECEDKKITCCTDKSFYFVDDQGNVITGNVPVDAPEITKEELLSELEMFTKNFTELPKHAMLTPITHYDFSSALLLLTAILRADKSS
jgi:hypothetical protein